MSYDDEYFDLGEALHLYGVNDIHGGMTLDDAFKYDIGIAKEGFDEGFMNSRRNAQIYEPDIERNRKSNATAMISNHLAAQISIDSAVSQKGDKIVIDDGFSEKVAYVALMRALQSIAFDHGAARALDIYYAIGGKTIFGGKKAEPRIQKNTGDNISIKFGYILL